MQLAGELAKMNLASLIRLVRNGELTGKICLNQGGNTAFLYFEMGQPIHVEVENGSGREALLELFLWQTGTFSYMECAVHDVPCTLSDDEPLEKMLKDGIAYLESLKFLEQLQISPRTIFRSSDASSSDLLLSKMDGKTPLGSIVQGLSLSRSEYVMRLKQLVASGKAVVVEQRENADQIQLPEWVLSRLKQDDPDVSKSIVQLVIWADRIKCWLYQADVDLQRVINALENPDGASTQLDANLSAEMFHPQQSSELDQEEIAGTLTSYEAQGPREIAESTNPAISSAHSIASAKVASAQTSRESDQSVQSSATPDNRPRGNPGPPTYDF